MWAHFKNSYIPPPDEAFHTPESTEGDHPELTGCMVHQTIF